MSIRVTAFADDNINRYIRLLVRAETTIPTEYAKRYRKNVVKLTPKDTGRLRRSITTQAIGTQASITWRAPYALAQNRGGHTVKKPIRGENKRDGGYGTIKPGFYKYTRYTTAGTGPQFAGRAFQKTNSEIPEMLRELGVTK